MSRYAVKIGEIHIRSDKPITDEERERVKRLLLARGDDALLTVDDLEVVIVPNWTIRPRP